MGWMPAVIISNAGKRRIAYLCLAAKLGLVDEKGEPVELARGAGCRSCFQSGYAGREVIAEALLPLLDGGAHNRFVQLLAHRAANPMMPFALRRYLASKRRQFLGQPCPTFLIGRQHRQRRPRLQRA